MLMLYQPVVFELDWLCCLGEAKEQHLRKRPQPDREPTDGYRANSRSRTCSRDRAAWT